MSFSERLRQIREKLERGESPTYLEACWLVAELERLSDFKGIVDDGLKEMAGQLGLIDK